MLQNPLADAISAMKNAEKSGKRECTVRHASTLLKRILKILQDANYIGNFEYIEDGTGGKFRIELLGKINDCGVITPRFSVKKDNYEVYEKRFLPAVNVGILVVSTSKGIVSHRDVRGKVGGTLIAYIY